MDIMHDAGVNIRRIDQIARIKAEDKPQDNYCSERKSHGIQLRLSGKSEFLFGGRTVQTEKGDVLYLPKGLEYTVSKRDGGECLSINFDTEADYDLKVMLIRPRCPERFQQLLSEGTHTTAAPTPSAASYKLSIAYSVLSLFQQTLETEYSPKEKLFRIKPAIDYLEKCGGLQDVNVEILAGICKITPAYFRQLFHRLYGMNPRMYIENFRIERAKRAIESGANIKTAAEAAGFNDASYFCKVFKRHIGMTPGEYANTVVS